MITWGISANSHDAAIAVFDNEQLVFASHSERFSGIKNDPHLHPDLVAYAMMWGSPGNVVWYENPYKKTARQLYAGQGWRWQENNIKNYLRNYQINAPITYASHHHSHAAAGYYTSQFSDATVICIDSIGEFETLSVWQGNGSQLTRVHSQGYPHSIGLWYSAMTQRVGLTPNEDEYILMGMAAYGNPQKYYASIKHNFFDALSGSSIRLKHNLHRGCKWWKPELKTEQDMFDIAAATQAVYERALAEIVSWATRKLPSKNLVLMGGCALNCSANSILYHYYDNVWIMPNPGDAGSAVGAVLADRGKHITWPGPYLGYDIKGQYPVEETLQELLTNQIAGVASGPAEYGPRALGNRSLLADPRGPDIKDRVNEIKRRQRFRPFAPVILEEHASNYFSGRTGHYMQFTSVCKQPDLFPAIVHADHTSRVQTVPANCTSGIRQLLEAWYDQTGCPMLLNTSLNIKGMPMVNTMADAAEFSNKYNIKVLS